MVLYGGVNFRRHEVETEKVRSGEKHGLFEGTLSTYEWLKLKSTSEQVEGDKAWR